MSRWRFHFGDHPGEPAALERLILEKLRSAAPEEDLETEKAFLKYRYGAHLRNYRRWGGWYSAAFIGATLVVVASGLLSSTIGAGWRSAHWAKVALLGLGLATAIVSAVNHLWRPGRKGTSRIRGANRLCADSWAFLEGAGQYRGMDDIRSRFALFVDEVGRILAETAEVDEADADLPQTPRGGS